MRVLTAAAVVALMCAPALAGCSDDQPEAEPVVAAQLPDNLCAAVPGSVVTRWSLVESDHATVEGADRNEADCSMTGEAQGAPVSLEVSITSFAAADRDAVRQLMADDLAARCRSLEESATGSFTDEDHRCSSEAPAAPASERGRVTEYSLSIPAHGVVAVTMQHAGELWRAVPADVVAVGATLGTTDPADLS